MNLSAPFISRPVGTTLLTLAVALVGLVAFTLLPVAPLPQVDFATIRVRASLPGASPETMASAVATPLERTLGRISGITEMTSESSLGSTSIVLQFDLDKNIDGAAREVQSAINAARAILPDLPDNPTYRKMNPADSPIMIISLTSDTLPTGRLYDYATTILSQKLSQVNGVGQVNVGGGSLPAVRVGIAPAAVNGTGLALEDVASGIARANSNSPKGVLDDGQTQWFVGANAQLSRAEDFAPLIIRHQDGASLRLSDVAGVEESVQDIRNVGYTNGKPSILLVLFKQPGANVIETVGRVRETLPALRSWLPESVNFSIIMDRSLSIAASEREMEQTLLVAVGLVILVVFLFLRNARATLIPAVAVPVSLLGTFAVMYLCGFSLNHLSLMALIVATGFVVDDAIVVTENIVRHMEDGAPPVKAALLGSREVAFTVLSISLSLIAIFIPILGMGGLLGRLFREFAVTMSAAILISLMVSLVATPMLCAHVLRPEKKQRQLPLSFRRGLVGIAARAGTRLLRKWGDFMDALQKIYARTLAVTLRHRGITLSILFLVMALNVYLYIVVPKGFFPQQDVGQIFGRIRADQSISFQAMQSKLLEMMEIVRAHPAVESVGGYSGGAQANSGWMFVTLKPRSKRGQTADQVINELRKQLAAAPGTELFLFPMQDLRMGGRQSRATYQYTLQSDDLDLLRAWSPRITEAFQKIPGMADVSSDQETHGQQVTVVMNRDTMARLGVTQRQVDTALGLAFGQRFVSTIYTDNNQYRVVMEFAPQYLQGPEGLLYLYVPVTGAAAEAPGGETGALTPLAAVATFEPALTSLSVSHQGQFPAATISFNLLPGYSLSDMQSSIAETLSSLGVPDAVRGSFQGTAGAFAKSMSEQPLLILAAIITLYIVLGILYESLIHPLTILSTLPSAGVGALLALMLFRTEFTVIAFLGVLLLFGIVKKNAILMIDFALEAKRRQGLSSAEAIYKACQIRFRPILMTTMAAVGGAVPLMLGSGDGAEMRTPLGISIIGGLLVSQLLTLYTTPAVYLFLDRFSRDSRGT